MASQDKFVYFFGEGKAEGNGKMKDFLGGKGAGLAEMTNAGIPVPPGFTITTEACRYFYSHGHKLPPELKDQYEEAVGRLEKVVGKRFGDVENPLLVSVRSGAKFSMPGMMDTILNLGLNDEAVKGVAKRSENERFAYDAYRRFLQMFGNVVLEIEKEKFEAVLTAKKEDLGKKLDTELTADDWKDLIVEYKRLIREESGKEFPQDALVQLEMTRDAVFKSWNNPRAITYRKLNKISDDLGTAVNVQAMVFGNMGNDCATGVGFTRNPATGEKIFYGEYLTNAQGEDVVAGIRTPHEIADLEKEMPEVYRQLKEITSRLEKHYKDVQDFEFTIEKGKLYMLQTRNGKRTAQAAIKIAVDMVKEKLLTKEEALMRVDPEQLNQLLHPIFDPSVKYEVLAKGLPASPGAAVGKVVFTAEDAVTQGDTEKVILVRTETCPDDIAGMDMAQGILTARGGMTCIAGETLILTNRGFFSAEKLFDLLKKGEKILILSYDSNFLSPKWKKIIATGKRKAEAIEVLISQSGRTKYNSLKITPDHKMYTFYDRQLIKKPLEEILNDKEFLCVLDKIPSIEKSEKQEKLAYLMGATLTDGYINLKKTKGNVTFTQKNVSEKEEFIQTVSSYFSELFPPGFTFKRSRVTGGILRGRKIEGEVLDLICFRKGPAAELKQIKDNLVSWILGLDEISTFNFLAGVIDGDGTFFNNRVMIFASKEELVQAIVVSCLKLGIVPQGTVNRGIYNLQILERLEEILSYTKRVKGNVKERFYGTKLFAAKQIFSDILDKTNYQGRIRECVRRNLLIDSEKIIRDILPVCNPKEELKKVLESNLRMYRVKKTGKSTQTYVYNFEVEASSEMDKNYVVFTRRYTPVLVSNSHAAVVARGMGKCAVVGCEAIRVDEHGKKFTVNGVIVSEGELISLNGNTGEVILGKVSLVEPGLTGDFGEFMTWADEVRKLGVRANADIPRDAKVARKFGAEGIGLCRTEHMFFAEDRLPFMQEMIVADTEEERRKALDKLLPFQKEDFKGLFKEMEGLPVTIRTLDPPLHEFLPKTEAEAVILSKKIGVPAEKIWAKSADLHEFNPMLGHRGCRLGITYPEITEMQVKAIILAAIEVWKEDKVKVVPEIMIPLVGNVNELRDQKALVDRVAEETMKEHGVKVEYHVGTMIEVPRGALTADEVATEAEFFSCGTNDLTQMTMGFSRDDSAKFTKVYIEKKILPVDPFQTLDQDGVGQLVKMAVEKGRKTKPNLKVGICGEHGGDPESIKFCHRVGLNYVSCSPYRVPIARLAAAQAAIEEKMGASTHTNK